MKTAAIIVAAGGSARMGRSVSKPYLNLAGKPVLYYCLQAFERAKSVDSIFLVVKKGDERLCERSALKPFRFRKLAGMTTGGKARQESVLNGLESIGRGFGVVLIHDAARPFITPVLIDKSAAVARKKGAVIVAVPVKDTIKSADGKLRTLDRRKLWAAQTPQAFRYELIMDAIQRAFKDNYIGTDDAELVERLGRRVEIVEGTDGNIKITTPVDLLVAETLMGVKRK